MNSLISRILRDFRNLKRDRYSYEKQLANQFEIGFQNLTLGANKLIAPKFSGFAQGEEDFFLYAISRILNLTNFLEFGVEDWRESNTRILSFLLNGNFTLWDGSEKNIAAIKQSREYFLSQVYPSSHWITQENIQPLITEAVQHLGRPFDVISIDIDGNDYWICKAIQERPSVFVVEYNSLFGADLSVSTPYKESFNRRDHHSSGCVYGASHSAFVELFQGRGYELFHTTEKGNNMLFLRSDVFSKVKAVFAGNSEYKNIAFREYFVDGNKTAMNFAASSKNVLMQRDLYIDV
jgi:hypothetical protein